MPAIRQVPVNPALRAIKVAHTLVWAVLAGCIVALPIFAWRREFPVAFTLIAMVGLELVVLVFNGLKCALTGVAARYTEDRQGNFDIYLPLWIARYNKQVFGKLFLAGAVPCIPFEPGTHSKRPARRKAGMSGRRAGARLSIRLDGLVGAASGPRRFA